MNEFRFHDCIYNYFYNMSVVHFSTFHEWVKTFTFILLKKHIRISNYLNHPLVQAVLEDLNIMICAIQFKIKYSFYDNFSISYLAWWSWWPFNYSSWELITIESRCDSSISFFTLITFWPLFTKYNIIICSQTHMILKLTGSPINPGSPGGPK